MQTDIPIPADVLEAAQKVQRDVGAERSLLKVCRRRKMCKCDKFCEARRDIIARALLADRAAQVKRMARLEEALKPFADEFARIKKNHEGFESLLSDDATYVGGKLSLGHLHDAACALSQEGSDAT